MLQRLQKAMIYFIPLNLHDTFVKFILYFFQFPPVAWYMLGKYCTSELHL
jgi:hypothetical protein